MSRQRCSVQIKKTHDYLSRNDIQLLYQTEYFRVPFFWFEPEVTDEQWLSHVAEKQINNCFLLEAPKALFDPNCDTTAPPQVLLSYCLESYRRAGTESAEFQSWSLQYKVYIQTQKPKQRTYQNIGDI